MTYRFCLLAILAIPAFSQIQVEGGTRLGSRVAAGAAHTCAIVEGGTVQCWGDNASGQLGDDSLIDRLFPVPVSGITSANPAISIVAGSLHSCALLADGTVRCWGRNAAGQLGNNSTTDSRVPVAVQGLTFVRSLSAGNNHACAVLAAGTVRCWGDNGRGQIGDGTLANRLTPVVARLSSTETLGSVVSISGGGAHTCALLIGANVFCWGFNSNGQLGTGNNTSQAFATFVPGLTGTKAISAGSQHTCALRFDATVKCWGDNAQGQLGDNSQLDRNAPVAVQAGVADVQGVSAGQFHTCLLRGTGIAVCWGQGTFGQIGEGNFIANRLTPQFPVSDLSGAFQIESGTSHSCAIRVDDSVRCWGRGNQGQIGDGGVNDRNASELAILPGTIGARGITLERAHACAGRAGGNVACWGVNFRGQLGLNDNVFSTHPSPGTVFALNDALSVSAGRAHTCALRAAGLVSCWGSNVAGELGDGTTTDRQQPVAVLGLSGPSLAVSGGTAVSQGLDAGYTCALIVNGTVQCWGDNAFGQLGNGSAGPPSLVPVTVNGLTDAIAISAGANHACALRVAGTAVCWGLGNDGRLGNGALSGVFGPTPVAALNDAVGISARGLNGCAPRVNGRVSCWGNNVRSQLGGAAAATTLASATPVQIQNLANAVTADSGGTSCAVRADGSLACWGQNNEGQLGAGGTGPNQPQPQTIPVVTAALTAVEDGGSVCALTASGQPFCWGNNRSGELGLGDSLDRFTPAPVPSFTFNVLPRVTTSQTGSRAEVTALANCPEGARVRIDVTLTQGSVTGDGHANGECKGRLERYAVDIHTNGNTGFVPGAATATADAEVRQQGQTLDNPRWTRAVTIQ